jgi:hypothetical protein
MNSLKDINILPRLKISQYHVTIHAVTLYRQLIFVSGDLRELIDPSFGHSMSVRRKLDS